MAVLSLHYKRLPMLTYIDVQNLWVARFMHRDLKRRSARSKGQPVGKGITRSFHREMNRAVDIR